MQASKRRCWWSSERKVQKFFDLEILLKTQCAWCNFHLYFIHNLIIMLVNIDERIKINPFSSNFLCLFPIIPPRRSRPSLHPQVVFVYGKFIDTSDSFSAVQNMLSLNGVAILQWCRFLNVWYMNTGGNRIFRLPYILHIYIYTRNNTIVNTIQLNKQYWLTSLDDVLNCIDRKFYRVFNQSSLFGRKEVSGSLNVELYYSVLTSAIACGERSFSKLKSIDSLQLLRTW